MDRSQLIEFFTRELRVQTLIAEGIRGGDRWIRNHDGIDEDVTEVNLAEAERRISEAEEQLARLNAEP